MNSLQRIALLLTFIGTMNMGLIGFFEFDLIATIFDGQNSITVRIIYSLVGLAGIINLGLVLKTNESYEKTETRTAN